MKNLYIISLLLVSLSCVPAAFSQDYFGGSGIKKLNPFQEETESTSWNKLFPQSQAKPKPTNKMSWPKFNFFKKKEVPENGSMDFSYENRPKFMGSMPRMFQRPEPGQPGAFETFNSNAADFWGRTTSGFSNWARETNQKMKQRSSNTWNNITNGFSKPFSAAPKPTAPPVRSARNQSDQPRVKF